MSDHAIKNLHQSINESEKGQVLTLDLDDCIELANLVKDVQGDDAIKRFVGVVEFRRDVLKVSDVLLERSDAEDVLYHAYEVLLTQISGEM